MTLDDVDRIEQAIVNSTNAPPGNSTYPTGRRLTAPTSFSNGYGVINPERCVRNIETTIADPSVAVGGTVGAMSFVGLAYPGSRGTPKEFLRSLLGRSKR